MPKKNKETTTLPEENKAPHHQQKKEPVQEPSQKAESSTEKKATASASSSATVAEKKAIPSGAKASPSRKKEKSSGGGLWVILIPLVLMISTWTVWLPYVSPDAARFVVSLQMKNRAIFATKIYAPESPDSSEIEAFLVEPLRQRVAETESHYKALSDRFDALDRQVGLLADRAASPSFSKEGEEASYGGSALNAFAEIKAFRREIEAAKEDFKTAENLNRAFKEKAERFLKAFTFYEALEEAVHHGDKFHDSLEGFQALVGPSFEAEAFQTLGEFAAFGVPSKVALLKDIEEAIHSEVTGISEREKSAQQEKTFFERVWGEVTGLIKVRPKEGLTEKNNTTLELLKKAQTSFQKGDFESAAIFLKEVKEPTAKAQALLQHTMAYHESRQALMKVKKHLYSSAFLKDVWTSPVTETADRSDTTAGRGSQES